MSNKSKCKMSVLSKQQKTSFQHTKKQIRLITKEIEQTAIGKINRALTCGALDENSEFLGQNQLLARTIIEDVVDDYKLKTKAYIKEGENLKKFL